MTGESLFFELPWGRFSMGSLYLLHRRRQF